MVSVSFLDWYRKRHQPKVNFSPGKEWEQLDAKRIECVDGFENWRGRKPLAFAAFGHKMSHIWRHKDGCRYVFIPSAVMSTHPLNTCPVYMEFNLPRTERRAVVAVSDLASAIGVKTESDHVLAAELGMQHHKVVVESLGAKSALMRLSKRCNFRKIAFIYRADDVAIVASTCWRRGEELGKFIQNECVLIANELKSI